MHAIWRILRDSIMKLVLMEPISPGPGNPAIRRGLFSFTRPSFSEIVEFISVAGRLPLTGPTRVTRETSFYYNAHYTWVHQLQVDHAPDVD